MLHAVYTRIKGSFLFLLFVFTALLSTSKSTRRQQSEAERSKLKMSKEGEDGRCGNTPANRNALLRLSLRTANLHFCTISTILDAWLHKRRPASVFFCGLMYHGHQCQFKFSSKKKKQILKQKEKEPQNSLFPQLVCSEKPW